MEEEKLAQLKTVYDALWSDAKTMIKDMNNNIKIVFLFGVVMLAIPFIEMGTMIKMYSIALATTSTLHYFYFLATLFGSIVSAVAGVGMLYWYSKLKKRYAKLIQLEKTLED